MEEFRQRRLLSLCEFLDNVMADRVERNMEIHFGQCSMPLRVSFRAFILFWIRQILRRHRSLSHSEEPRDVTSQ